MPGVVAASRRAQVPHSLLAMACHGYTLVQVNKDGLTTHCAIAAYGIPFIEGLGGRAGFIMPR